MKNLKQLRQESGLTQQKLADFLNTNQQTINGYKNRGVKPDYEILIQLAEYFNTSVDFLIGHTEIRIKIVLFVLCESCARPAPNVAALAKLNDKNLFSILHTGRELEIPWK